MKFPASALLVLLIVPVESALCQESHWDKLIKLSPGSNIEVVDAQSGAIEGQLVSIDDQGLTLRRKGAVTDTIARSDVISVTVKRPSAKKIALLALGGSGLGALAGGSRCKGPTDTYYNGFNGTTYSTCRNPNGSYFDGKGAAIGAGAGAALGLLGFAFPEKKILYQRSPLAEGLDFSSPATGSDSAASKAFSLQSLQGSEDKASEFDHDLPTGTIHLRPGVLGICLKPRCRATGVYSEPIEGPDASPVEKPQIIRESVSGAV